MWFSERETYILKKLERTSSSIKEIYDYLSQKKLKITKITLNRDLKKLENLNLVLRTGKGKASKYQLSTNYHIFKKIDFAEYFSVDPDDRKIIDNFNPEIFSSLKNLFTSEEIEKLDQLNTAYKKNIKSSSSTVFKKELERLIIELSWKSSRLEGNTYDLLETEVLLKEKIAPRNRTKEETVMILNHKKTLDYIVKNRKSFLTLNSKKIIQIHQLVTEDLGIQKGFRKKKIGIIGTRYKPLETTEELEKAIKQLCNLVNQEAYPLGKALIALSLMSYIQAFEDGNKRTARMLLTAILLANDFCPISFRNVDDFDYKKSIILFYEQNNITFLKKILIQQFEFSVNEYF